MSSIRLLKDDPRGKRGEVISVPFTTGKDMIAAGIGEYPKPGEPMKLATGGAPATPDVKKVQDEALAAMAQMDADHKAEIAKLEAEHKAALEAAEKKSKK